MKNRNRTSMLVSEQCMERFKKVAQALSPDKANPLTSEQCLNLLMDAQRKPEELIHEHVKAMQGLIPKKARGPYDDPFFDNIELLIQIYFADHVNRPWMAKDLEKFIEEKRGAKL